MKWIRALLRGLPIAMGVLVVLGLGALLLIRIEREVEAEGEIQITHYQIVRPQVSGIIAEVLVENGATVRAGQVLCRLMDYDFERQQLDVRKELNEAISQKIAVSVRERQLGAEIQPVERARKARDVTGKQLEQAVQSARTRELDLAVKRAEETLTRLRHLREAGLASDQAVKEAEYDKLQAEQRLEQSRITEKLELAEGAGTRDDVALLAAQQRSSLHDLVSQREQLEVLIQQLTLQLDQLKRIAEQFTLRAEISGVVVMKPVNAFRGSKVDPGAELFSIIDTSAVNFLTYVPEEEIIKVRAGQEAVIELAGMPKRRFGVFAGQVLKVSPAPQLEEESKQLLYPVEIRLQQPWVGWEDKRFFVRNGMRGEASIAYDHDVPLLVAIYDSLVGREDLPSGS